jgi:hypothetical protein
MIAIDHATMRTACQRLASVGSPHLPLFTAAEQGRVDLVVFNEPAATWRAGAIKRLPRPTVILVGDDPDIGAGTATGPQGWSLASKLRRWAQAAIIHGAEGKPEHYREAVALAEIYGRLVVVDTSSTQALAWGAFLNCPRSVLITPAHGPHPVMPTHRVMQ